MKHLLVSGIGRSGTSAFRMSLGMHPDIYYNGRENNIVQDVLGVAMENCVKESRQKSMVVEQTEYDAAFLKLFYHLIWPDEKRRHDAKWLMAAVNFHADISDYALQVFPDCKMIYLVRNGIEVIASRMRHRVFQQAQFEEHCRLWLRAGQMAEWGADHPEQFRLIRQEWFHDSILLDEKLKELWSWLDLAPCSQSHEQLINKRFHPTVDGDDVAEVRMQYESFSEVQRAEFQRERRERWRSWTEQQRDAFTRICGKQMRRFEYDLPWQQS